MIVRDSHNIWLVRRALGADSTIRVFSTVNAPVTTLATGMFVALLITLTTGIIYPCVVIRRILTTVVTGKAGERCASNAIVFRGSTLSNK